MHGEKNKTYRILQGNLKERENLKDLGAGGRIY